MNRRVGAARYKGFTLLEVLVATAVLALLILLVAQLFDSATTITTIGNKRMDADTQARALLDRMALDFGKIVKRPDVDYYLKGRPAENKQEGNDQIAFYTEAPGYYPAEAKGVQTQSPVSLVAYRLNPLGMRLQRLGKGLIWNGVSTSTVPAINVPIVFLPVPMASPLPSPLPSPMPDPQPSPAWPHAADMSEDPNGDYEYIGPSVFRFEYYYVLNGIDDTNGGILSVTPWDTRAPLNHASVEGLRDVLGIAVVIAVLDAKSRVLVSDAQLQTLAGQMTDFDDAMNPGDLESQWQAEVDESSLPRVAASAIRIYNRTFSFQPR